MYQNLAVGSGVQIAGNGSVYRLPQDAAEHLSAIGCFQRVRRTFDPRRRFFLAYGPRFDAHAGTDDFDFTDPCYQLNRFKTLFLDNQPITDPVAYLRLMQYRGIRLGKYPPTAIMHALCRLLKTHLHIDATPLLEPLADLDPFWHNLPAWQRKMALPLIDACRHLYDAFPRSPNPLDTPGVIIFHRPDSICKDQWFGSWVRLADALLPNMQFIITLPVAAKKCFPQTILNKKLVLPDVPKKTARRLPKPRPRLPKKPILLVDVDSKLPNLALMKLSRYFKEKGKDVVLVKKKALLPKVDRVFASCVFNGQVSLKRVASLKKYYGKDIRIGGSGVDLQLRLPAKIERLPADFDLYPELKDRAIGFITRGCPHKCPFCLVPVKEGQPRQVCDVADALGKNRKKLILLDDNLLSHKNAVAILDEMARMSLKVNFTQSLDIRHVTQEKAALLRRIDCMNTRFTRSNHYFSLNDNHHLAQVAKKYQMFGFRPGDNVEFIFMYGFNMTLAQDVERFRFLRTLPGAYVFAQQYRPICEDGICHNVDYFEKNADALIDELISITFTQNMRSVEKYYRWVSRKYAQTFGKLHMGLVDAIFKYNNRYNRGEYIATLAGTRKWR